MNISISPYLGREDLEEVVAEAETGNTTDSSSSSDEDMFPTSLEVTDLIILAYHLIILCQDVNSGDRTFNSILSLLVGRQSVSQTLRLLRQEVRAPGEEEEESSSGETSLSHAVHILIYPMPMNYDSSLLC